MTEPTRPCGTCGMPCTPDEYHPYAACLMFKACHNSETVRANLEAVRATPQAVGAEPVGWMWQHDETGRTGFVDCWQVENGWQENNPRLRLVSKLYTTPQPTQAQAGAVPLTDGQAKEVLWSEHLRWMRAAGLDTEGMGPTGEWLDHWLTYVRAIERAHGIGIKGGQHGTE